MAEFSASEAAFTGFRVVAARPWLVPIWALLQFAFSLAITCFAAVSGGPAVERLYGYLASGALPPPDQATLLMHQLAPTNLVVALAGLVYYAIFYAAMSRAVLRPSESRFAYLRLGPIELRELGLFILLLGVGVAIFVVTSLVAMLVGSIYALVASPGGAPALMLLVMVVVGVPLLAVAVVRLSLAPTITFAGGKTVSLGNSWRLTRGHFWPIFGTYLLALALNLVVVVCAYVIALLASVLVGGPGAPGGAAGAPAGSLAAVLAPAPMVYLVVVSLGEALRAPVLMTPPTYIYAALTGAAPVMHPKRT